MTTAQLSKQKFYGQNFEDKIISSYFGQFKGTLLSIGENDGETFSNALCLIENGWQALLVEPSEKVWPKLVKKHFGNERVVIAKVAIGDMEQDQAVLYDSGDFLLKGTCSLLSTLKPYEMKRWGNVQFEQAKCKMIKFETLLEGSQYKKFQMISIDAEGFDLDILRQIDLADIDCRCLIIEWNSLPYIAAQIHEYVSPFGFKEIHRNAENLIYAI